MGCRSSSELLLTLINSTYMAPLFNIRGHMLIIIGLVMMMLRLDRAQPIVSFKG